MSSKTEERSISSALGSIPKQYNNRAFNSVVTVTGTGLGDITVNDVTNAVRAQHPIIQSGVDQLYVHDIKAYGSAGGYLSLAPYPHKQYAIAPVDFTQETPYGMLINCYAGSYDDTDFRRGSLCQMYGKLNL